MSIGEHNMFNTEHVWVFRIKATNPFLITSFSIHYSLAARGGGEDSLYFGRSHVHQHRVDFGMADADIDMIDFASAVIAMCYIKAEYLPSTFTSHLKNGFQII